MILREILERYSVRKYQNKDVPQELILECLEAARLAPSANNRQPWKFIVVRDSEIRKKIGEPTTWAKFIKDAPVLIVGCVTEKSFKMGGWYDSSILDIGIAMEHIALQATHLGLGTCWIGDFDEKLVKELLNIPEDVRVAALMTLGYSAHDKIPEKRRKKLEEIVSFEKY
ncbi:MAG: nitroreductase family protein [Caldisericia bacterium]|nr:nitroreductase family protein [Caldisericia bacterium]